MDVMEARFQMGMMIPLPMSVMTTHLYIAGETERFVLNIFEQQMFLSIIFGFNFVITDIEEHDERVDEMDDDTSNILEENIGCVHFVEVIIPP